MGRHSGVPRYRLHKSDGRAVVTINGKDIYVVQYGTIESKDRYEREINCWLAGQQKLPLPPPEARTQTLTVSQLILAYWQHADAEYGKHGVPTRHLSRIKLALGPVRDLFGPTPAARFDVLNLKACRRQMFDMVCGHCEGRGVTKGWSGRWKRKPRPCSRCKGWTLSLRG